MDDAAGRLHAAVEKVASIAGTGVYLVFDLVTSQESMRDILEAAGQAFGLDGRVVLVGAG